MLELLQAERIKLARHRAAWLTVWILPIGLLLVGVLATTYEMVRPGDPKPVADAATWIRESAEVWRFPANTLGRYLVAAFTAVAFGGEYGWNTWKLVGPHRNRSALITAKYVVVIAILTIAYLLFATAFVGITLVNDALTNEPTPPGVQFGALLAQHGRAALPAAIVTLLTVAYVSSAAILTRSTMAGAIVGIVAVTVEELSRLLLAFRPALYHWSPSHHLANLATWIGDGKPLRIPVTQPPISDHWTVSAIYIGLLIAGLVALTYAAFRRQDLN